MDIPSFLIQILNSVQYGLLLFLCASGLTLVFGIMGVINLAHGSLYMIGAYLGFSLTESLGSLWLALPAGVVLSVAFGAALEWLLIERLYQREHLHQVLLTYGLILVFEELRSVIWGDDVHGVAIPPLLSASIPLTDTLSYPVYRLWMSGVCLLIALLMAWVLRRTRLGMIIRAGSVNSEMVQSLGINIAVIHRIVFAAGVGLAALAGMLATPVSSVFPGMGNQVLIICFVVVVIGGIGSLKGALVGALLIGVVDTFGKVVTLEVGGVKILPELAGMSVYLLMAVILIWRPEGLFGKSRA